MKIKKYEIRKINTIIRNKNESKYLGFKINTLKEILKRFLKLKISN